MSFIVRAYTTIGGWKNPEYTGSNRCVPCTVVNVVLSVGVAATIAAGSIALGITASRAAELAVGVFVLCSVVIYFNGYLVPGTPALTKRYLPDSALRLFGKTNRPHAATTVDPETELRTAGLLVEDGSDLALHPSFETAWMTAANACTNDESMDEEITRRLATLAGVEPERLELSDRPHAYLAWYDNELIASWESRAACVADVAAVDVISEFDSLWHDRPLAEQAELLGALRLFIEQCPVCDGAVTLSHEVVSSCCYDRNVIASTCDDCGARLFEIDADAETLVEAV